MTEKEIKALARALALAELETEAQGIKQASIVTHTVMSHLWGALSTEQHSELTKQHAIAMATFEPTYDTAA